MVFETPRILMGFQLPTSTGDIAGLPSTSYHYPPQLPRILAVFSPPFPTPPPTWIGVRFELRGQGIFQVGPLHRHLEKNWRFRWVFFDEIMFEGFVESVTTSNLYVFFVQIFVPSFLMICGGKEYLRIFCLQVSTNLGFCCHIEKL